MVSYVLISIWKCVRRSLDNLDLSFSCCKVQFSSFFSAMLTAFSSSKASNIIRPKILKTRSHRGHPYLPSTTFDQTHIIQKSKLQFCTFHLLNYFNLSLIDVELPGSWSQCCMQYTLEVIKSILGNFLVWLRGLLHLNLHCCVVLEIRVVFSSPSVKTFT